MAYLIDFARALVVRREPNRETLDAALLLASVAIMLWAWPALGSGDGGLIRLHATQFLLLSGALSRSSVERQIEEPARSSSAMTGVPDRPPAVGVTAPAGWTLRSGGRRHLARRNARTALVYASLC